MKNLQIFVQYDCTGCNGTGWVPNPDYDVYAPFPGEKETTCGRCFGARRINEWVTPEKFVEMMDGMALQELQTIATEAATLPPTG